MAKGCISNRKDSNEIRKQVKNGKDQDALSVLRKQRLDYPKNLILGHLNVKPFQNKFDAISELIKGKVEIF